MQITPRTDERIIEIAGKEYVTAAFAKQLERELQDALAGRTHDIGRSDGTR